MITVHQLSKAYRISPMALPVPALQNVSFDLDAGKVLGLLGMNGAGKSTLTRILLGLTYPDSGNVTIRKRSAHDAKSRSGLGYLPEAFHVPRGMTAVDLLRYVGRLRGLHGTALNTEIGVLLETLGLEGVSNRRAETFSKGMTQRLGIAQAILHRPSLLVLDEPTEGLDPIARRLVREILQQLAAEGMTIWMTSHVLSEVELLANQIVVLHKGCLVRHGSLQELLPRDRFTVGIRTCPDIEGFAMVPCDGGYSCTVTGHSELQSLLHVLQERGIRTTSIDAAQTNLEQLFLSSIADASTDASHPL